MKFQVGGPAAAASRSNSGLTARDDVRLREHRERDAEVRLAELGDLLVGARLLAGDVVGGEAEDHEALVAVLAIELLEALELRGEAALAGGVDDQHHLAAVSAQSRGLAVEQRLRAAQSTGPRCPPSAAVPGAAGSSSAAAGRRRDGGERGVTRAVATRAITRTTDGPPRWFTVLGAPP